MKYYLLYTRRRRIGVPYSKCISPNIISTWNTFCVIGFQCLQTLFYQFYKIGTSLNIIESDQMLHDATYGLGLQCSPSLTNCKPRERQRRCRIPRLNSCNRCQMIWFQISPGFSCLTWVKLLAFVCLFDLILYVHSTIFQLCGTGLPGLNQY